MGDWAAAMGIEAVYIDKDTTIRNFKNELRWNELRFESKTHRMANTLWSLFTAFG